MTPGSEFLSAAVRCDKNIPSSEIIIARQGFSAHANHRYIGSSPVILKLAISHSTTFAVPHLAPTMVLQYHNVGIQGVSQCWDTSQDLNPGSDKTWLHAPSGNRNSPKMWLEMGVPSCCGESIYLSVHKNDQKCHLWDPFRARSPLCWR